jgi:hypothetical protein
MKHPRLLASLGLATLAACASTAEQRAPAASVDASCPAVAARMLDRNLLPEINENANALARTLKRKGLDTYTYMAKWKAPNNEAKIGPWAREGNTLVVGTVADQVDEWMETVGKKSFGFMVNGLPEDGRHTGILRVGDTIYYYDYIQEAPNAEFKHDALRWLKGLDGTGRTEATFMATPEELRAIKKFIEDRAHGRVTAQSPLRGYAEGEAIRPEWSMSGDTLLKESCSSACTSPFDFRWISHYRDGQALQEIAEALMIKPEYVAKRNIWSNFRNPYASAITLHRIDLSKRGLVEDFVNNNNWHPLRGLPQWGIIPDPRAGQTGGGVEIERVPLAD